jgi:uncharacterized protein (TIGR03067 family)
MKSLNILVTFIAVIIFIQQSKSSDDIPKELEGSWKVDKHEYINKQDYAINSWLIFNNNKLSIANLDGAIEYAIVTIRKGKENNEIDIEGDWERNKDYSFYYKGIYSLKSDRLIIRWIYSQDDNGERSHVISDKNLIKDEDYLECSRFIWDSKLIEGECIVINANYNGVNIANLKGMKWNIKSDQYKIHVTGNSGHLLGIMKNQIVILNQFKKPKKILINIYDKNDNTEITDTLYGIYKIDNDIITICINDKNKIGEYPDDYKSRDGEKKTIYVLRKEKDVKKINDINEKINNNPHSSGAIPGTRGRRATGQQSNSGDQGQ